MTTETKTPQTNGAAVTPPPAGTMTVAEKNISDMVFEKLQVFQETGSLNIPKNYSAANAIRIAWLMVQEMKVSGRPVLEVVTKNSVANAFLKMIVLGLNPYKRQGSFIAYGSELQFQKEYQGTIAIAKRHGVKSVTGCAVFKGDVFEYVIDPKTGIKTVTKHEQKLENIETGVVIAAYATKEYEAGGTKTEVMAMSQIKKAWMQGPMKGNSPAHINFPDEMAVKTVINRLLKSDVNSSDDSDLFDDEDETDVPRDDVKMAGVKHQIAEKANKTAIDFQDAESETIPEQKKSAEPAIQKLQAQPEPVLETAEPGY